MQSAQGLLAVIDHMVKAQIRGDGQVSCAAVENSKDRHCVPSAKRRNSSRRPL